MLLQTEEIKRTSTTGQNLVWYKDAIIYEVHVRAFCDSDSDGMGDFRGLTQKLDYLQELGVTVIWVLPFYPSPLKDDGYDISDYKQVHPSYGTLADFKLFLKEAHRRDLRVITELVLNHTSDEHEWFQRARRAPPGSLWRDFYVWSDNPEKYKEARIIFKDFEPSNWTWDPVASAYYWHRFYSHQPDLNFDNPEMRKTMFKVVDFWLGLGVDGLRLDAVPYLYEREGTNCENLPETHQFLKALRQHIDERFSDRMLLAEANQWPEDAVAYFGQGDECHMAYHFPLMPRMFMAVRMEDRYPIIDILEQTPPIPENSQWALFLRNHDELTLEMVTDEERDYMYRTYAHDPRARINLGIRHRLAPLLGKDRKKIELMNALLFSLPGTPVIYYGDEIGMGDNIYVGDRNGVRTPMQWSADRNAGFSRSNPQRLYLPIIIDPDYHYEVVNVEARQNNLHSPLWFMKRLIAQRRRFRAFGRGTLELLEPENHKVLAFIRRYEGEVILVITNLSRFCQYVELDLSKYKDLVPMEVFGQTRFPPIGDLPYLVTLGPHAFYWLSLEPRRPTHLVPDVSLDGGKVVVTGPWESVFTGRAKSRLEEPLRSYLVSRRWFGGKARQIRSTSILDTVLIPYDSSTCHVALVEVAYTEGAPEVYLLPCAFAEGEEAASIQSTAPGSIIARLVAPDNHEAGILYDGLWNKGFCRSLLEAIGRRRHFKGNLGDIVARPTRAFAKLRSFAPEKLEATPLKTEQSNTSILYGDQLFLKVFRRLGEGVNPELEIGSFLTEKASFPHISKVAGALEYRSKDRILMTVGVFEDWVKNEGDAWKYTLDNLSRYFERISTLPKGATAPVSDLHLLELAAAKIDPTVHEMIGTYLEAARLLGQRTAELHLALASDTKNPAFAPEPFSLLYQRSVYQSMRNLATQVLERLRKQAGDLSPAAKDQTRRVLDLKSSIMARYQLLLGRKINAIRTRVHGDYHLGQVLYTGKDFVIIDFEGEPARPLSERLIKRSSLYDVAGMLRSFSYAAYVASLNQVDRGIVRPEDVPSMEPWVTLWIQWVSSAFLKAYLEASSRGSFLPAEKEELKVLLGAYLLDKSMYELAYELNNRPDWVRVPIKGILELLRSPL
jgi:maltose alpha-D-glucosyltransferase / alpha-amylase